MTSDDANKCCHVYLGMASGCGYHRTGQGTLYESAYWRCSEACKSEQRRRQALKEDP